MFSKYIRPLLFLGVSIAIISVACDSTVSHKGINTEFATLNSVTITPSTFDFTLNEDGFKDTTVVISINTIVNHPELVQTIGYTLSEAATNEIIAADMLTQQNDSFITSLEIETTTTSFNKYVLKIALYDVNHEESTYQTNLTINGFSNNRPVIEEVNGPQEITRPTSGETPATFTARVTDADGDDTINQVFMRIIDKETGEVTGSPFQMLDDGTNLGDETASDYIFTLTFDVTATDNRPDRDYDLQFFAVDLGGLTSDTVKTTFSIRE